MSGLRPTSRSLALSLATAVGLAVACPAQGVQNLSLLSDGVPDLTDMESFVRSSTSAWATPEEKCIAVWRWGRRLRRQTSCAVEDGRLILDPILHYNSYGAMNCGIISALNIASWIHLGYRARYVQLGDHTVSEVSWDEGTTWHVFDSSMSIFCRNHDGSIASCEDVRAAGACALSGGRSEPGHCYLYHYAPPLGSHPGPTGWRRAADQPVLYERTLANGASSYTDGFSVDEYCQFARYGRRHILNLRPGESLTRHWHPLDDLRSGRGPETNDPAGFRPMADGSDPDDQHGLNDIRGNGVWVFRPDLREPAIERHLYDRAPIEPGKTGHLTFKVSAADVIASLRIDARCRRRTREDGVRILVSRTAGIRWTSVWEASDTGTPEARLSLRDEVAGHTECLVRFELRAATDPRDVGLESLEITTITQLNRRALPALRRGTNRIVLRAGEPVETIVLWPKLHAGGHAETVHEACDVFSADAADGGYKATLGAGANGRPCHATWRIEAPADIVAVTYAVVATNRSPHSSVALLHSWDGVAFEELFRDSGGDGPFDRQVLRRIDGARVPGGARTAYLKCLFEASDGAGTWNMPGIQDVVIQAEHRPRVAGPSPPVFVTYAWTEHRTEGEVLRTHVEKAASLPHEYEIHVGGFRDPAMEWVRLSLAGSGPEGGDPALGYSDGVDVGPGPPRKRVSYEWGENPALGRAYVASRPSSASSGNPDEGSAELTNGIVIAPTDLATHSSVLAATAFWEPGDPVAITLDLEAVRTVSAVRVATHQPGAAWCHPARIDAEVSLDGVTWRAVGSAGHDAVWSPPADDEPWEHEDSPRFAGLPAGGRLAQWFAIVLERPVEARRVRVTCTPLAGRGMGLSEIQVPDRVAERPWPEEVVHSRPR